MMNKKWLILTLILGASAGYLVPVYGTQVVQSLGFIAPEVDDTDDINFPAVGEIVYDAGAGFKGYAEGGWTALSGSSTGGNVETSVSGSHAIEVANVTCGTSSSITNDGTTDDWLTSIGNRTNGTCVITVDNGVFSSTPYCFVNFRSNTHGSVEMRADPQSSTSINLSCKSGSDDCNGSGDIVDIMCFGKK